MFLCTELKQRIKKKKKKKKKKEKKSGFEPTKLRTIYIDSPRLSPLGQTTTGTTLSTSEG